MGYNIFHSLPYRLLVEYTDREHKSDLFGEWREWKGYLYAGAMLVTACIQSLAFGQFVYLMNTIGMRINTALIGLVYEKVIKMLINFNVDTLVSKPGY